MTAIGGATDAGCSRCIHANSNDIGGTRLRYTIVLALLGLGLLAVPGSRSATAAFGVGALQANTSIDRIGTQAISLTGPQPWVTILCKFQDVPDEPHDLAYFQGLFANVYPGLDHYWREVSYDTISLAGSSVVGWYTLPNPKSYYVYDRNGDGIAEHNNDRTATDCTAAADAAIDFTDFYGINLIFNANMNATAIGGSLNRALTLDGKTDFWPMTWVPLSYISQGVIAHEMGHGFRLGDIYVKDLQSASGWGLMGAPCYYGSQRDPLYRCVGLHLNAASKHLLGWIPDELMSIVPVGGTAVITLEQLALPQTNNDLMVRIPINGSDERYYTVEVRHKTGYDNAPIIPGPAVLIHETTILSFSDGRQVPIVELIPVSGTAEPGGAGAMWKPGMTFVDPINRITVAVQTETSSGFVIQVVNSGSSYSVYLPAIYRGYSLPCLSLPKYVTVLANARFKNGVVLVRGGGGAATPDQHQRLFLKPCLRLKRYRKRSRDRLGHMSLLVRLPNNQSTSLQCNSKSGSQKVSGRYQQIIPANLFDKERGPNVSADRHRSRCNCHRLCVRLWMKELTELQDSALRGQQPLRGQ
ncbi:hypothetical protein HC891_18390 [Candidatus Gracilibacteria bacterium]|nr:hypothetical protein [Candidatus Gracilibacteria bacterium]